MSIIDIPADQYHNDAIGEMPTLSASIAHILCSRTPLHAWTAHPRLNPDWEPHTDTKFDLGTVVHAMLLEGDDVAVPVFQPDWRTKVAKEARDRIREEGRVPLLAHDWERAKAITAAVGEHLAEAGIPPFDIGDSEVTLAWQEKNGVHCRSRLDWLDGDHTTILDLKTTSRSANPETFSRNLYALGYDLKAHMYIRAVKAVTGIDAVFRWIVVETTPPYALSVIEPGPDVLALGEAKAKYAIETWSRCLRENVWPGYPTRICTAELPAYEEARWMEHADVAA